MVVKVAFWARPGSAAATLKPTNNKASLILNRAAAD
jgi:hypothetical protein